MKAEKEGYLSNEDGEIYVDFMNEKTTRMKMIPLEEFEEIKRLAEIGKAIELAFEKDMELIDVYNTPWNELKSDKKAETIEELLEWYRKEVKG